MTTARRIKREYGRRTSAPKAASRGRLAEFSRGHAAVETAKGGAWGLQAPSPAGEPAMLEREAQPKQSQRL